MDLLLLSTVFVCLLGCVVGGAILWKIAQVPPLAMLLLIGLAAIVAEHKLRAPSYAHSNEQHAVPDRHAAVVRPSATPAPASTPMATQHVSLP
jgi:hypothetical protein